MHSETRMSGPEVPAIPPEIVPGKPDMPVETPHPEIMPGREPLPDQRPVEFPPEEHPDRKERL